MRVAHEVAKVTARQEPAARTPIGGPLRPITGRERPHSDAQGSPWWTNTTPSPPGPRETEVFLVRRKAVIDDTYTLEVAFRE